MGKGSSKLKWDYESSMECLTDESKNYYEEVFSPQSSAGVCAPIVGYEVQGKKKTFSVYKLHVITTDRSWFVYRTYEDFVMLHNQLRKQYPSFCVRLPKKRRLANKFSKEYLQRMRKKLQIYFEVLMQHDEISTSEIVKDFLRLINPPGVYENIDQCRTYCEELQETVAYVNKKLEELQNNLDQSNTKLAEAFVKQKLIETKLADEKDRNARLLMEKQELEKRVVVFPELTEVKNFDRHEGK